jgi:superfamily II DNA or RNA helicase
MIVLKFDQGNIIATGGEIPFGIHESNGIYRAPAYLYSVIVKRLSTQGIKFKDEVENCPSIDSISSGIQLRKYQLEALSAWKYVGSRGIIILPTGSGKTIIALKAIEEVKEATLIIVPTIVLLDQWKESIEEAFDVKVGVLGGGRRDIQPITVTTYDSASIRSRSIGNRFRFLIFDEVHHLPASSYRRIGFMYTASYRLGLTATLSKDKELVDSIAEMVGELVYERSVDELAGKYLSDYSIKTIDIPLSAKEQLEYDRRFF